MSEVKIEKVYKSYNGKDNVVKNVSLHIDDGEFMVFVGPSGCGKSTTLRMIAGLEEITSGDISIGSRVVNNVLPKDRNIAMVFQNYALYPHMTVYENMAFALKLRKVDKKIIKEKVLSAAKILGLDTYLDRRPGNLSGGQRQRVALGRAIVRDPEVFLFDEPLSNLDAKLRVQMRTEIIKLHKQLKTTMVYVTHDQTEAMTMGDRICVMKDGDIMQVDTPLNLYSNPTNRFVAGFIGSPSMNFIEGEFVKTGDIVKFKSDTFNLDTKIKSNINLNLTSKVQMGIRPEFFNFDNDGQSFNVEVVEPLGNETFVYFKTPQGTKLLRTNLQQIPSTGNKIKIKLNLDNLFFFDAITGKRISNE
ncbi:MAG: sn-glycerol-3-phosphate ABC transporter ATP-binding protein UgpC [Candidatus Delongbacteria bacterium]|nr:sn-glycerol-3-phosphate ABC transporter ATP-binding protein UgpC [Candidatus Delongbacteria bacterium]MBN2836689.1 sn-glycerol-3-phosphate ABC transporter ATP-binding protein UgpC [Candidatus Delongbacteria bacterium]